MAQTPSFDHETALLSSLRGRRAMMRSDSDGAEHPLAQPTLRVLLPQAPQGVPGGDRPPLPPLAPLMVEGGIRRCEWCGEAIPWWRLLARLREPPLCSRTCVQGWMDREL
jgi:hypothetical protein